MAGSSGKDFECITIGYPLRGYHVCYGYSLEVPLRGASNEYQQLNYCFMDKSINQDLLTSGCLVSHGLKFV